MMTELEAILPLWRELTAVGMEYVLATIVAVEGSGYRKPGAMMLVAADGRRTGTISGGCLEAEVAKKAFWHTQDGPAIRRYSMSAEDGDIPFGMGCGGIVHLLLERNGTADPLLERMAADFAARQSTAVATVIEGKAIGLHGYYPAAPMQLPETEVALKLNQLAEECAYERRSWTRELHTEGGEISTVVVQWHPARPGLFVFGAGDDAIPLVKLARQLGWYVAVADGRSHLATATRFPEAHSVHVLKAGAFPDLRLRTTDTAVILTHSMEQDANILGELLRYELAYIGVLGPQRRTRELLLTVAQSFKLSGTQVEPQLEKWMGKLHAPMGLDLGGDTPADVALAVIAEIQQCLRNGSGMPLRIVRGRQSAEMPTIHSLAG